MINDIRFRLNLSSEYNVKLFVFILLSHYFIQARVFLFFILPIKIKALFFQSYFFVTALTCKQERANQSRFLCLLHKFYQYSKNPPISRLIIRWVCFGGLLRQDFAFTYLQDGLKNRRPVGDIPCCSEIPKVHQEIGDD